MGNRVLAVQMDKKTPRNFTRRRMCVGGMCRQAAARGGLCAYCHGQFVDQINADLSPLGLTVTRLAVTPHGYIRSIADGSTDRIGRLLHRVVMEAHLGRALLPGETVHHRNGNRADNRPRNLELWVTPQPKGQRPPDLANHARELLALYGNSRERTKYAKHLPDAGVAS